MPWDAAVSALSGATVPTTVGRRDVVLAAVRFGVGS
jgi:hypothetical protein